MNKNEFMAIVEFLESNYKMKISESKTALSTWFDCLQDLDFPLVMGALKKHALTSEWPPTIASIRKQAADINGPRIPDHTEAWGEVTRAMSRHGSWNHLAALDSMSQHTRRTVIAFGWDRLCIADNVDVVRGQFLKMYDSLTTRDREDALLPESFRIMLQEAQLKRLEG